MIPIERLPTLLAAIGVLLLAGALLWVRPTGRLHRALALFLFLRAVLQGLLTWSIGPGDLPGRLVAYVTLALPFAALNVGYVFLVEHGWGNRLAQHPRAVRSGLLGLAILLELLYLWDHSLYTDGFDPGPLQLSLELTFTSIAAIALVVALAYRRATARTDRRALYVLLLGFALEPAFQASFLLFFIGGPWTPFLVAEAAGAVLTLALIVALVQVVASRGSRFDTGWLMGLVAAAIVTAGLARLAFDRGSSLAGTAEFLDLETTQLQLLHFYTWDAIWTLALVGLAAYGAVRYELFGIELKAKTGIQQSAVLATVTVLFVVTSETIEAVLGVEGFLSGIAAAGVIVLALYPLERLARRAVDRLLPKVQDTPAYWKQRRAELYTATLETIYRDGEMSEREAAMLARLEERLGMDPKEAASIRASFTIPTG
ncbi:MAG: hypothetical protein ACPGQL_09270 [Thermoplasmatota archaeon]